MLFNQGLQGIVVAGGEFAEHILIGCLGGMGDNGLQIGRQGSPGFAAAHAF